MAACAMRGIRYISFPPIVFETPAPVAMAVVPPAPEPVVEPAPAMVAAVVMRPPAAPVMAAPFLPPEPAAPRRRLAEFAAAAEEETAPPPRLRRLAELTAADTLGPPTGEHEPPRRYALLNDIAVELRPRRVRARSRRPQLP